jgi:hypothetical protein
VRKIAPLSMKKMVPTDGAVVIATPIGLLAALLLDPEMNFDRNSTTRVSGIDMNGLSCWKEMFSANADVDIVKIPPATVGSSGDAVSVMVQGGQATSGRVPVDAS